jgi:hypothetical protein
MSWTVACFCGNVYLAPPDRCAVCGCSIDGAVSGDLATSQPRDAGEVHRLRLQPSPPPGLRATTNQ